MSIASSPSSKSVKDTKKTDFDLAAERKYPSIRDYYYACSTNTNKPIQYQNGLANFSNVQLGDDRIQFLESVMTSTFKSDKETERPLQASKLKTKNQRQREYELARVNVSETEIDRLERVMKDKLFQRSEHVSSPFQIRKALKFFDAEKSGYICLEDFTHALEFLGFQFNELQNMALFAKYDPDCTGSIDYMIFIKNAMFDDPTKSVVVSKKDSYKTQNKSDKTSSSKEHSDFSEAELRSMQESELKRVFKLVSKGESTLEKSLFELLLMALGYYLTPAAIEGCLSEIPSYDAGKISMESFITWWMDRDSSFLHGNGKK